MKLYLSDCLDILGRMKSDSVDSIVCDPPYGIEIGNLDWDKSLPSRDIWRECFRILKPGGHIIAFSSARLYHHLAVDMEAAGFDTHNMMAWLYGNGFPKGGNLARQFDRTDGLPLPDDRFRNYLRSAIKGSSYKIAELEKMCGTSGMFNHYLGKSQPAFPTFRIWKILKEALGLDSTYDSLFEKLEERRKEYASKKEGRRKSKHFECLVSDFERHRPDPNWQKSGKDGGTAGPPCVLPWNLSTWGKSRPCALCRKTSSATVWAHSTLKVAGSRVVTEKSEPPQTSCTTAPGTL